MHIWVNGKLRTAQMATLRQKENKPRMKRTMCVPTQAQRHGLDFVTPGNYMHAEPVCFGEPGRSFPYSSVHELNLGYRSCTYEATCKS